MEYWALYGTNWPDEPMVDGVNRVCIFSSREAAEEYARFNDELIVRVEINRLEGN